MLNKFKEKIPYILIALIIIASLGACVYFYPLMPARMASHWDGMGKVNGYMPKFWGLFLMPFISILMFALFIVLPKIDPLKKNIEHFKKYYETFVALIILFLFYIYALTLAYNLGYNINMVTYMLPALAILMIYTGYLLQNAKQNWFIGIRTPWTLSSETVWNKTHRIGAVLFKIIGILTLAGLLAPAYAIWLFLVPAISAVLFLFIYSYAISRHEK